MDGEGPHRLDRDGKLANVVSVGEVERLHLAAELLSLLPIQAATPREEKSGLELRVMTLLSDELKDCALGTAD
jgi:hypothetical protein